MILILVWSVWDGVAAPVDISTESEHLVSEIARARAEHVSACTRLENLQHGILSGGIGSPGGAIDRLVEADVMYLLNTECGLIPMLTYIQEFGELSESIEDELYDIFAREVATVRSQYGSLDEMNSFLGIRTDEILCETLLYFSGGNLEQDKIPDDVICTLETGLIYE